MFWVFVTALSCACVCFVRLLYRILHPSRDHFKWRWPAEQSLLSDPKIDHTEEWVCVRGRRLYRQSFVSRHEKPLGVVVWSHGMHSWGAAHFSEHIPHLLSQRLAVVSMDSFGHGRSDGLHGDFDPKDMVEDLHAHVQDVKRMDKFQKLPVFLLGGSLGGHITLQYIRKYPQSTSVRGVVLLAPAVALIAPSAPPPQPAVWLVRILGFLVPELPLIPLKRRVRMYDDDEAQKKWEQTLREWEGHPLCYSGGLRAGSCARVLHSFHDLRRNLHQVNVPLLIVHGSRDKTVPVETAHFLFENVPHIEDKELKVFDGCTHNLFAEPSNRSPEIVAYFTKWMIRRI